MDNTTIKQLEKLKNKLCVVKKTKKLEGENVYTDDNMVMAFCTKREDVANVLGDPNSELGLEDLDYNGGQSIIIDKDYLKDVLKFILNCRDITEIKFTVKEGLPLVVEIEEMDSRFVLAPRTPI